MLINLLVTLGLLACSCEAGDLHQQIPGLNNVDQVLQKQAQSVNPDKHSVAKNKYFHNITDDKGTLALFSSSGPLQMELVQIVGSTLKSYKPKVFYNMTGSTSVTGSRSSKDVITINVKYTGADKSGDFVVKDAEVKLVVKVGGKTHRPDYWLMTSANMAITYSYKGKEQTSNIDLTPEWGYSKNKADLACGTGYSVCAPLALTWTCNDQSLKLVTVASNNTDKNSAVLHIPGMKFQPFKEGSKNPRFGYSWDCDPLIPISIWSSLFVTLLLAAVVVWAIAMVTSIFTPSKFDDPKGPSIQIAQTE